MKVDLAEPMQAPFVGYDIPNLIGRDFYWQRLAQYCENLIVLEYNVPEEQQPRPFQVGHLPLGVRQLQRLWRRTLLDHTEPHRITFNWPRTRVKLIKHFVDRRALIDLTSWFVDDLFLNPTRENGKETWCEKTPQNIFHLPFLKELFPGSVFIHVKRDPRGVVQSVIKQAWGPNTLHDACLYLADMYKCWFDIAAATNFDDYRYIEVSLENLALDSEGVLSDIASFVGVDNSYEPLPEISVEKVDYWKDSLSSQDLHFINGMLGDYITKMGYDI
jgi:hypothetical protein